MIHTRVLELLKNPKNIQSEDLHLLKEEIDSFPYIQNVRALHLYGVHLYDKENYQKALSETAAYTTDKKILYQLINGKVQKLKPETTTENQEVVPQTGTDIPFKENEGLTENRDVVPENTGDIQAVENRIIEENENKQHENPVRKEAKSFSDHDYEAASEGLLADQPEIVHLVVNGERNRILFEGEENFLDENDNETIDIESTLESGVIVTHKSVSKQGILSQTDKEDVIVAEELAGTSSEKVADSSSQIDEVTENTESTFLQDPFLQKEEIKSETATDTHSDKTEELVEVPKSASVIDEDEIDSVKTAEKIKDENEVSFQKVESFSAETANEKVVQSGSVEADDLAEAAKSESVIHEDEIDSAKVSERIKDENETDREDNDKVGPDQTEEISEAVNTERIIDEGKIESSHAAEKLNDDAELSFHGTESFLPEIKIESGTVKSLLSENSKPNINKHEDEMRRLIEEVEKRMKERKDIVPETKEKDEEVSHDISFAETQAFHVGEEQKAAEEVVVTIAESIVEEDLEEKKLEEENKITENDILQTDAEEENISTWKPMSFETSRPDSLLIKSPEISKPKEEIPMEAETSNDESAEDSEKEIPAENKGESNVSSESAEEEIQVESVTSSEQQKEEAPVMNVSFFGSDIASLGLSYKSDQKEKAESREQDRKKAQQKIDDSNIPGFINTWQSWLKIDRVEDTPVDKTEIKNKVIESFIENNPKISQLKDEVNFVVKEKTDDISHLMTETLANLYIEQKLYSKAMNAFLILSNKHPERKEYFEEKIQEIKDNRGKN
nr:hypothetical protein [uncultured Chryseobacterium sp.]